MFDKANRDSSLSLCFAYQAYAFILAYVCTGYYTHLV
jgi:hypothetical protein